MHPPEASRPHYEIGSATSGVTRLTIKTTFDYQQPALCIVSEIVAATRPAALRVKVISERIIERYVSNGRIVNPPCLCINDNKLYASSAAAPPHNDEVPCEIHHLVCGFADCSSEIALQLCSEYWRVRFPSINTFCWELVEGGSARTPQSP